MNGTDAQIQDSIMDPKDDVMSKAPDIIDEKKHDFNEQLVGNGSTWMIFSVESFDTYSPPPYPGVLTPKKGRFIVVDVEVKNTSGEDRIYNFGKAIRIEDTSGNKYFNDEDITILMIEGFMPNSMPSEVSFRGLAVFDVPKNAGALKIIVENTDGLYFDLGVVN